MKNELDAILESCILKFEKENLPYTIDSILFIIHLIDYLAITLNIQNIKMKIVAKNFVNFLINEYGLLGYPALLKFSIRSYSDIRRIIEAMLDTNILKTTADDDPLDDLDKSERKYPLLQEVLDREEAIFKQSIINKVNDKLKRKGPSSS